MTKQKVTIVLDDYDYDCGDGCCTNYGTTTMVDGVELFSHNQDPETILKQVLEHLGFEVDITQTYNGK